MADEFSDLAQDDNFITDEDTVLAGAASVLANDSDIDTGNRLTTVTAVNGSVTGVGSQITLPSGALLTLNADGTFAYDPNGQFEYLDARGILTMTDSFSYTAADGLGTNGVATVIVTLDGVNDAPAAEADAFATDEDTVLDGTVSVLANDSDIDAGDRLTVTGVNGSEEGVGNQVILPSGALLTLNADGTFAYDPNGQFEYLDARGILTMTDSFSYTVSDNHGASDTETVIVTLDGVNDAPVAEADAFATDEDTVLDGTVSVLANDSDIDAGDRLKVTGVNGSEEGVGSQVTLPSGALLTLNADGTFAYDPNGQFEYLDTGDILTDVFSYTVSDSHGASDTETVTLTVDGVYDPPIPIFQLAGTTEFSGKRKDYLDAGHNDLLAVAHGTISMAFNADKVSGTKTLFSKDGNGYGEGGDLTAWIKNGALYVRQQSQTESVTLQISDTKIEKGDLHHLAVSFGKDGLSVYLDGVLTASEPEFTQGLDTNSHSLLIGASGIYRDDENEAPRHPFDGSIGSVMVFDKQLSDRDVSFVAGTIDPLFDVAGRVEIDASIQENEVLIGGHGRDKLEGGDGDDHLDGGHGQDVLKGGDGDDVLEGGQGRDKLEGGDGDDILSGGQGRDVLKGGDGNDTLSGGHGRDVLKGEDGDDTFRFDANFGYDTIVDFEDGSDLLSFVHTGLEFDDMAFVEFSNGTKITSAFGSVFLEDIHKVQIDENDFLFA